jgi:hypothetical protein
LCGDQHLAVVVKHGIDQFGAGDRQHDLRSLVASTG